MQKIVIGIIAVFFVQVGFLIYQSVGRTNYAFRSVSIEALRPSAVEVASNVDYLYLSSFSVDEVEPVDRRTFSAEAVKYRPVSKIQPQQTVAYSPARRETFRTAPIGPDVIITIPPPVRPNYVSTVALANATPKREKKRSFFSKSLHVLKKPYDWLKTVAMKID